MRQDQSETTEYHIKWIESILKLDLETGQKVKGFRRGRQILSIIPQLALLEDTSFMFEAWNKFYEKSQSDKILTFDHRKLSELPNYVKFVVELKNLNPEDLNLQILEYKPHHLRGYMNNKPLIVPSIESYIKKISN